MSAAMNDVAEHWNMPWHAWLKSLAQTSKPMGAPHAAASGLGAGQPDLSPGSWLIRARGRAAPMAASTLQHSRRRASGAAL
jgi:hypothetical protein